MCQPLLQGDDAGSLHQVIGVGDYLLLDRPGHAVTRRKAEERTLIGRQPGPYMPLNDRNNRIIEAERTAYLAAHLRMAKVMRHPPADIVEESAGLNQVAVDDRIGGVVEREITNNPAVSYDTPGTPRALKEGDAVLLTHPRGTP